MSFLGNMLWFFGRLFPRNAEAEVAKRAETRDEDLAWPESVVDLLKAIGRPSDMAYRRDLARQLGELNYSGTEVQNIWLHGKIMEKVRTREW